MKSFLKKIIFGKEPLLYIISVMLIVISFLEVPLGDSIEGKVKRLESRIQDRQRLLEKYSRMALDAPEDKFLTIPDLPEDMSIYRYCGDTLNSWINQLPISNDEIYFYPFGYRINYMNSRAVANTPLAYLSTRDEQYVSLGSGWYIVKVLYKNDKYTKGGTLIISALLVQTDYRTENDNFRSEINPKLKAGKNISIVPVTFDESYVVKGKDGGALFFVLKNTPNYSGMGGTNLRWIAVVMLITALFLRVRRKKNIKIFLLFTGFMVLVKIFEIYLVTVLKSDSAIFSPTLYADFGFANSLADLLINNILIVLVIAALYQVRKAISSAYQEVSVVKKRLIGALLLSVPGILLAYIAISLRSLILNSSIVLELYKIDEFSIYTAIVYFSYGTLFTAMLYSLNMLRPLFTRKKRVSFLKIKPMLFFITFASLFILIMVSIFGYIKENNRNRVWVTKMSIERDLNMELQLRAIEQYIQNDPIIIISAGVRDQDNIFRRLTESYLWSILQNYDVTVRICDVSTLTNVDEVSSPVNCFSYFKNEIENYGIALSPESHIFFMNNSSGKISYIGEFEYQTFSGYQRMYLVFESKLMNKENSYRNIMKKSQETDNINMPPYYSYAKYLNNKLVTYGGEYNYPVVAGDFYHKEGYYILHKDKYVHFVNAVSGENIVVISRPRRSVFPYIVSFSYTMIFLSFLIFGFVWLQRMKFSYKLPRNSFRSKITILVIASLMFALISMGAGSIWYTLNYIKESNRVQMEGKMESVQDFLSDYSLMVDVYNDPSFNNTNLLATMTKLARNTQIDINIYSPDGRLIRTTLQEIFDNYMEGYRINPVAFNEIVNNHKKQVITKEKLGNLSYYSLYSPLFNRFGKIIAIVNIPFFSTESSLWRDSSSIIATIINIYLLLLIAAVLGGVMLSNSLSRPLNEISKKMELLDVNKKTEHIDYNNKDELGILVAAYNKMVDDLEESTRQLAQSEREQAWREMARQIAHEIKNPLTPMRLSIQHLVRLKKQNVPEWQTKFDEIAVSLIEQIDILSDAASEFSSFSRFYSEELTEVDICSLVKEQITLFNTRDNIDVILQSKAESIRVILRKGQIIRVLVNLISNAIQAVESLETGKILVTVNEDGEYIVLTIEDNGSGVPEDLTGKLFKPNFTTKSGGTGLGLYICRSIIEQSQGKISYSRSESLGGACFTFALKKSVKELL
jgi:signal transduction histidine kinase